MADSLWESIVSGVGDINSMAKDINGTYQEIKNGATSEQSAEKSAQGTSNASFYSQWAQPAVIVAIIGVGIAILGLVLRK